MAKLVSLETELYAYVLGLQSSANARLVDSVRSNANESDKLLCKKSTIFAFLSNANLG